MRWRLIYTRKANKDAKNIKTANLQKKTEELLALFAKDPFATPPRYERLVGNLNGAYSRRINIQHRLVYQVLEAERTVKVLRMWSRYE